MRHQFSLAVATALSILPLGDAVGQVVEGNHSLPLTLALKAATSAIASCETSGYRVSAVVVDPSGVIKIEAKGDHSTIHTTTSAYRKAYTVVTFGPIFRFDASSAFASLVAKNPNGAALAMLPDIAPLAGAVAIKAGDEIIGALGVSGSPGGDKDEACAQVGVAGIQSNLAPLPAPTDRKEGYNHEGLPG